MPLSDFKVVRVVAGRYFDAAGAEIGFDIFVRNHGYLTVYKRQNQCLADYALILSSSGFTATATSPSIVSGLVVATVT